MVTQNLCDVFGCNAVQVREVQQPFARFRQGNLCLEDGERSGL